MINNNPSILLKAESLIKNVSVQTILGNFINNLLKNNK